MVKLGYQELKRRVVDVRWEETHSDPDLLLALHRYFRNPDS